MFNIFLIYSIVFLPCSESAASKIDQSKKYLRAAKAIIINISKPINPLFIDLFYQREGR